MSKFETSSSSQSSFGSRRHFLLYRLDACHEIAVQNRSCLFCCVGMECQGDQDLLWAHRCSCNDQPTRHSKLFDPHRKSLRCQSRRGMQMARRRARSDRQRLSLCQVSAVRNYPVATFWCDQVTQIPAEHPRRNTVCILDLKLAMVERFRWRFEMAPLVETCSAAKVWRRHLMRRNPVKQLLVEALPLPWSSRWVKVAARDFLMLGCLLNRRFRIVFLVRDQCISGKEVVQSRNSRSFNFEWFGRLWLGEFLNRCRRFNSQLNRWLGQIRKL